MGGDSPMRLTGFPGEPEKAPRIQSVLGAVLADTEVVDRASREGEASDKTRLAFSEVGTAVGLTSGDGTRGEGTSEGELLFEAGVFLRSQTS